MLLSPQVRLSRRDEGSMLHPSVSQNVARIGWLQVAIILLAATTAVLHLYLGVRLVVAGTAVPIGLLFILNGVGYIVLATALYLPALQRMQPLIRWGLIGYTVLTIVLWYFIASRNAVMFDYVTKAAEIALVILLLVEATRLQPHTS
jgi:hypothetical protein